MSAGGGGLRVREGRDVGASEKSHKNVHLLRA